MRFYLALLLLLFPVQLLASVDNQQSADHGSPALTYRLNTIAVVRASPKGPIVDIWNRDTPFTSNVADGDWIRVTGSFPGGRWQPAARPLWINRHYVDTFTPKHTQPPSNRAPGVRRYVEIDKSTFELKVIEQRNEQQRVIFKTVVALGMDRCLPKSKGDTVTIPSRVSTMCAGKYTTPEG